MFLTEKRIKEWTHIFYEDEKEIMVHLPNDYVVENMEHDDVVALAKYYGIEDRPDRRLCYNFSTITETSESRAIEFWK